MKKVILILFMLNILHITILQGQVKGNMEVAGKGSIGIGLNMNSTLHVSNKSVESGPDKSAIVGTRDIADPGGISWAFDGVDVAIKGLNGTKNQELSLGDNTNYTAGVAGYTYSGNRIHAGVIGANYPASIFGALAYSTGGGFYSGYFKGAPVCILDDLLLGEISSTPDSFRLYVKDGILAERIRVTLCGGPSWPDYVFNNDYRIKSISEVESYVKEYNHLPNVPSAEDVEKSGIDLAKMDAILLRQIEELWLHIIEKDKKINVLEEEIKRLKKRKRRNK